MANFERGKKLNWISYKHGIPSVASDIPSTLDIPSIANDLSLPWFARAYPLERPFSGRRGIVWRKSDVMRLIYQGIFSSVDRFCSSMERSHIRGLLVSPLFCGNEDVLESPLEDCHVQ